MICGAKRDRCSWSDEDLVEEKIEKQIVLNWCRRFRTIGYLENFSVF